MIKGQGEEKLGVNNWIDLLSGESNSFSMAFFLIYHNFIIFI